MVRSVLEVTERERVLYLRVAATASLGPEAERLALDLADACAAVREREQPPVAVALVGAGEAFLVATPTGADEHDRAGDTWGMAVTALAELDCPTVAVLGGDAVGPAWEAALACDLRLAAQTVRIGSPEARWGRLPVAGGIQRLTRLAGSTLAGRLLLLGELIEATEAQQHGLLHRVVPARELEGGLEEMLAALRAAAPIALGYTREAIRAAAELPLRDGLRLEADLAALLQTTADRAEGISAFLDRRAAHFETR